MTPDEWEQTRQRVRLAERAKGPERRLLAMQARYGLPPAGVRCDDCLFYVWATTFGGPAVLTCQRSGPSSGVGRQWSANWHGCGAFERRASR